MPRPQTSETSDRLQPLHEQTSWGNDGDGVVDDLLAIARRRSPAALEATALRTKSFSARHLLARAATRGRCDYGELVELLRRSDLADSPLPAALSDLDPEWAIPLARAVGLQRLHPDDEHVAAHLLNAVHAQCGLEPFTPKFQESYAQLLYATGDRARLAECCPASQIWVTACRVTSGPTS